MGAQDIQTPHDKDREQFLSELLDALGGVVWEFDWGTGTFTYVSAAAESLLGFSREEWLKPGFWTSRLHPDDADWASAYCISATRKLQDHEFEYRMIHADGSAVWVRDIVTVDKKLGMAGRLKGMLLNVTASHEAHERAERITADFVTALGLMRDLYFRVDTDDVVIDCQIPSGDPFYLPQQEFLGRKLGEVLFPDTGSAFSAAAAQARAAEEAITVQHGMDTPDGFREWEARMSPLPDGGLSILVRDVTVRNARERELARSSEFMTRLLSMLDSGVLVIDSDASVITQANAPAEAILGYGPGELVGMSAADMHLSPEEHAEFKRESLDALREGRMSSIEIPLCRKDGAVFEAEVSARDLGDDSSHRIAIIRDVTDRKAAETRLRASEERFRMVVERSPFGMHFYHVEGDEPIFVGANPAADSMLGITHSELIGKSIHDAFPGLTATAVPSVYRDIALNGGVWQEENVSYTEGAISGAFEVTAFQLGQGEMAVAFRDVTERKVAEARERVYLGRLSAMAADLTTTEDRERRRLAEELHDRVGQPLAVARMRLRVAQSAEAGVDPEDLAVAEGLLEEAVREVRIVTTELAPPVLYELGLGAALRWLCEELERQYSIDITVNAGVSETGVDPEAKMVLFRAARELVLNVVKHARTDRAIITLENRPGWLVMTVQDHGRGFDSEKVTGGTGDSGFGLFSIRERLPHLGGRFEMETAPGHGTLVTLCVPQSE